jgi:hypothetical protein
MHSDVLVDVESGEMVSHIDVLGPGMILWVVGNLNSIAVVLENPAVDFGSCRVNRVAQFLHLLENPNNRKGVLKGFAIHPPLTAGTDPCLGQSWPL